MHQASSLVGAILIGVLSAVSATQADGTVGALPEGFVILGGLAVTFCLWLALAHYDAAAIAAVLLLGFVRFEPGPPDLLFGALIAAAAVTGRLRLDRLNGGVLVLLAAFLVLNVVSLVGAVALYEAARYLLITAYLVLLAIWLTSYATSSRRVAWLVRAYLAGAVLMSAVTSLAVFVPFPGSSALLYDGQRAMGLMKDPNVFGPFLVVALLVLAEETARPRLLRLGRPTTVIAMALVALGVLLSFSRAAWLNAAVGILVLVAVLGLRRRGALSVAVFGLVLLLIAAFLATAVVVSGSQGFLQERAQLHAYDAERVQAQQIGLDLAFSHPLGVGPGQYDFFAPIAAHSLYVRVFAEQGALGLIVILLLAIATLLSALVNVARGVDTYGLGSAALLAAWCGLLVNSLFVDTLHWRHFWLVAALIWAGACLRRRGTGAAVG